MKTDTKDIVVFVMSIPKGAIAELREYEETLGYKLRVFLLRDSRLKAREVTQDVDQVLQCDFSKPHKIASQLLPYQDSLLAITCRSEKYMPRFADVLPHVPYLDGPTTKSIEWSNDKLEMRERFQMYDPKLTPAFTKVKENTIAERARVVQKVGFPMIIKPANLAASRFVTICYHEEELRQTLATIFRKLKKAYLEEKKKTEPKVIAEQFISGDQYSVDSYVDARGNVTHCPLVKITTGKSIGHDDFYNYLQMTPTTLKPDSIKNAQAATESGIKALGLRSTIVHTELLKVEDDWKLIEIAARMGGFRQLLYQLSCDINHTLNDILNRIPKKVQLPKRCKGYACAIKWFADKEGKIAEMKGIKSIENLDSFHSLQQNKKVGDRAIFARNGGRSVFNLFLYNADHSKLLADIRRVEKLVKVKVQPRVKRTS